MEKEYIVKILETNYVTHDVKRFLVGRPKNFKFVPGQATYLSINLPEWKDAKRPFTFCSLNDDENLEFVIKIYKEKKGVTEKLAELKVGDELIIREPFGTIQYKGNGVFIAGGGGITPFIAILRELQRQGKLKDNTLIFSNKMEKDIILKEEFDSMISNGLKVIYTLTRERDKKYFYGRIDEDFLKKNIENFSQYFYVCGPIRFVGEIQHILQKLGADSEAIVVES